MLDGLPEQSSGCTNLPHKPGVCTSLHMASAHAVLPRLGNKARPPCLGLGLVFGDEDGDECPSVNKTGLHCVHVTLWAGNMSGQGSVGAEGTVGALGMAWQRGLV